MIRTKLGWAAMAAMVLCAGCDETAMMSPDGGRADAHVSMGDTGPAGDDGGSSDAGRQDAGSADAGPTMCGEVLCASFEFCLRDVCVAHCGEDLTGLAAALAEGLTPVQNFCTNPSGPIGAHVPAAGMPMVYAASAATEGAVTTFTLSRWALDPSAPMPSASTVATGTYTASMDGVLVFLGGTLAVSPDGSAAIFGYTTTKAGALGGVFDIATGGGTVAEVLGPGNFGAAWLDADHFVVNGQGLGAIAGGQGLYVYDRAMMSAHHAVTAMGDYSGAVALIAPDTLVAGGTRAFGEMWMDGAEGDRLFAFTPDAVLSAATPSAAEGSAPFAAAPSAFTWLPGRGIASVRYDDTFAVEAIELRTVTIEAGVLSVGAPSDLGTAPVSGVTAVGDSQLLVHHAGGLLLVQ